MNAELPSALEPHSYPVWIKAFAAIILLASIYSFTLLPSYLKAAQKMKEGRIAFEKKDYEKAIKDYGIVLHTIPSSKKAKVALAEVYFSNTDEEDDIIGLMELKGVKLDIYAWKKLSAVIPEKYWGQFMINQE